MKLINRNARHLYYIIPAAFLVFVVRIKRKLVVYEFLALSWVIDRRTLFYLALVSKVLCVHQLLTLLEDLILIALFYLRVHYFLTPLSFLLRAPI